MNEEFKDYKLTGKLRQAVSWSIVTEILFAIIVTTFFVYKSKFEWVLLAGFLIYTIIFIYLITNLKKGVLKEQIDFATEYGNMKQLLLFEMDIAYTILDFKGKVLWMNKRMREITGKDGEFDKNIATIFKDITPNKFPKTDSIRIEDIEYDGRYYNAKIKKAGKHYIALYLFDNTREKHIENKLQEDKFSVALIEIDNYDDGIENIDEMQQAFCLSSIEKVIYNYFFKAGSIIRKLEKDRYLILFKKKTLEEFEKDKFSILEEVKKINIGDEFKISLSIGIATCEDEYSKCFEVAKNSLDLALGRGGDQVVVRDEKRLQYYGGKTQQMERNARVKVRITAEELKVIFEKSKRIIIMGHRLPDIDSFGAAIGMYCFAKELNKDAYIVINDITTSVRPFYDRFLEKEEYRGRFLNSKEAISLANEDTTVVVVDVNKKDLTDCPELLDISQKVIVFDHHRQSSDYIERTILAYKDSFASSSCEMVTEMMQLVSMNFKLKGFEADAIYAGIVIDTDNFIAKAGPRTFEAAAYLRRNGADVTRVRKLLRADLDEYKSIAEAVKNTTLYKNVFAFSIYNSNGKSPTIGAAKTANQLLNVAKIKAAFVLTKYNETVYVSARSIDEVNVQLIMEKLGGGGHLNIAGMQFKDGNISDVVELIKKTIDKMIEDGEIKNENNFT